MDADGGFFEWAAEDYVNWVFAAEWILRMLQTCPEILDTLFNGVHISANFIPNTPYESDLEWPRMAEFSPETYFLVFWSDLT